MLLGYIIEPDGNRKEIVRGWIVTKGNINKILDIKEVA